MKHLTRDSIIQASDLVTEVVEVPEWGGSVIIKSLDGERRERWEAVLADASSTTVRAVCAAVSIVDDQGELMFTEDDVPSLSLKSWKGLNRIYEAVMELNKVESIEDEIKN